MKPTRLAVKQRAFLAAFELSGNVSQAALATGIGRRTHYAWLEQQEAYRTAFEDAKDIAADRLEQELYKAATVGIEEPVIHQGQLCFEPLRDKQGRLMRDKKGNVRLSNQPLSVRKFHPVAAFFLLKGMRPEKYRDNVKVSGEIGFNLAEEILAARKRLAEATAPPQ